MHLGARRALDLVSRAQFEFGQGAGAVRAAGLTLPGRPALVAGSNGAVAWGFTNAYGQWFDWIALPKDLPPGRLHARRRAHRRQGRRRGRPRGGGVGRRPGRARARRALVRAALDRRPGRGLHARARPHAGRARRRCRRGRHHRPAAAACRNQNIDHRRPRRPRRVDHRRPAHWDSPRAAQFGRFAPPDLAPAQWLAPADYTQVKDPAAGQLWTANARQLGGGAGVLIGDGGFDIGARAQQIRDRLAERPKRYDEASLRAIQLDYEARFMRSWRDRLLAVVATASPAHADAAALLRAWNGRADADQAGYPPGPRHAPAPRWRRCGWPGPRLRPRRRAVRPGAPHRLARHVRVQRRAGARRAAGAPAAPAVPHLGRVRPRAGRRDDRRT